MSIFNLPVSFIRLNQHIPKEEYKHEIIIQTSNQFPRYITVLLMYIVRTRYVNVK